MPVPCRTTENCLTSRTAFTANNAWHKVDSNSIPFRDLETLRGEFCRDETMPLRLSDVTFHPGLLFRPVHGRQAIMIKRSA